MRPPWLICCYSCGVSGWSKTEQSGDDPTRKLISQLPNKWTILELEGRAKELWLFCWYEPCCKLSCIVSRFEVTFKHSFEGFASKTIGDSLNNDTPETYMREVQDLENDRGIYKRKKTCCGEDESFRCQHLLQYVFADGIWFWLRWMCYCYCLIVTISWFR